MLLTLHPDNPNPRDLKKVISILQDDGIIIFPTDTIYAMGCKFNSKKGIERMCKLAGKKPEKVLFSLLCDDLSTISAYTASIDRPVFRLLKNNLPGPFTFILKANSQGTKNLPGNRKTIGIRIPAHPIATELIRELGVPMMVTTIHHENTITDFMTDPEEIYEKFKYDVDCVIDGGPGGIIPSTVIDCSSEEIVMIRQGKGILNE